MKLNNYIEHTQLKPESTKQDLIKLYEEAIQYEFLGVCVNGCNTRNAKDFLKNTHIKVVTVVGFPLGACTTATKVFETREAIENGADEIDMVMNIQALKDGNFDYVQEEIEAIKRVCHDRILKVIIETDLLTKEEIKQSCKIIIKAKADFAKTSTGFVKNGIGAKVEDILIMSDVLKGSSVKIKASGGIKTKEQAIALINSGASRLGTSSGVLIVNSNINS